jgi:hypothetical protein
MAGAQVVEHDDRIASLDQCRDHMTTDVARSTGDQESSRHCHLPPEVAPDHTFRSA